jgi:SRSO17 transposase
MADTSAGWEGELGRWLKPFLEHLGHKARQRMCPLYVAGLIGPGDRKSVAPMAERFAPGDYVISCIILLPLASGMRRRWKQNFSSKLTNSSAAAMRCW